METTNAPGLVIVGAGHAGSELAVTARQQGWTGSITLLGEEGVLPYQRPPLSKAFLAGMADAESLALRPQSAYDAAHVQLRTGRVTRIDRARRQVHFEDGDALAYAKLALCTGGRARPLACAGLDARQPPRNLMTLRNVADARRIQSMLHPGARVVVIGGGYVGLEVAASAKALGGRVTILEALPRVLARVAGEALSSFYEGAHRAAGVDVRTGVGVSGVTVDGDAITTVDCADGARFEADVVVAGLGMLPNVEAAEAAGLVEDGGILVDEHAVTKDQDVVAAGDCTVHDSSLYGRRLRLESVPNALEQARSAAAWVCGKRKPNRSVPWFWSDQYDLKLQTAGLSHGHDRCVLRGDPRTRSFCAFYLLGDRLLAVDAVNRPADFMLAKRMLAAPVRIDGDVSDESVPLKALLVPHVCSV